MADVVRRGTIIIDLVQGKAEFTAPDMGPVLRAKEQAIALERELQAAIEATRLAQERLIDGSNQRPGTQPGSPAGPGGSTGGGGGGASSWDQGLENLKNESWERGLRIMEAQKAAIEAANAAAAQAAQDQIANAEAAAAASKQLNKAISDVGEGAFRVARAFVLLGGGSDESLQKLIQNLALVQAGFDLFKGAQKIVNGLTAAEAALAAAQATQAAATAAATGATVVNTAATTTNTTAKLANAAASQLIAVATNPLLLGLAALTAAYMALSEAADYFTESEEERIRAMQAEAEAARILVGAMDERMSRERQYAALAREGLSDREKIAALDRQIAQDKASGGVEIDLAGTGPGAELVSRKSADAYYSAAASGLKEQLAIEQQILDKELQQRDAQVQAIKNQQQLVEAAQKQVDIEERKVKAFQAQVGGLSKLQQQQLIDIRDKLRNGQDITRGEEKRLEDLGGEQGRGIADARRAKRGAAAGFDQDFFKGIEGASTGMDDAAKSLKEAAEALKNLTGGATAAAKIAELEAEKKALNEKHAEFITEFRKNMQELIDLMKLNSDRIAELEISVGVNAAG